MGDFKLPGGLKCGNPKCGKYFRSPDKRINGNGFIMRVFTCPHCDCVNESFERVLNTREKRSYFSQPKEEQ